eukprot:CAMPEP_0118875824 /NCGR_PEP_ID=MMETSP1163-20130328/16757_1 /TAXON_ID=124430 /ORGANISM="Phaeomonas parva, Strain CCMP2877" /LENGTH=36 /DNA_ID= /DNA_START= /DNA_END= /DNA_ORIENTATION=
MAKFPDIKLFKAISDNRRLTEEMKDAGIEALHKKGW